MKPMMRHSKKTSETEGLTPEGVGPTANDVRRYAMDLLARREYSRTELLNRLATRFGSVSILAEVVEQLSSDGLQSDERFAELLVRSRCLRFQGPIKIRYELVQKGVDEHTTDCAVAMRDQHWSELALACRVRKFGESDPVDAKERARQQRFLLQRGFSHDQIRYALKTRDH